MLSQTSTFKALDVPRRSPRRSEAREVHLFSSTRDLLSWRSVSLCSPLTSLSMNDKSSSSTVEDLFAFDASTLCLVGARNVGGGGGNIGKPLSNIIPSQALWLSPPCVSRTRASLELRRLRGAVYEILRREWASQRSFLAIFSCISMLRNGEPARRP